MPRSGGSASASRSSSRSRGRSRSRDFGRRSSRRRLTFGRHQGRSYAEVLRSEPGYCRWALSLPDPRGQLRDFASWLRHRRPGDSEGDSDDLGSEDSFGDDSDLDAGQPPEPDPRLEMVGILATLHQNLQHLAAAATASSSSRSASRSTGNVELVLDRLPRVEFSASLFSGTPHPESCPVCMEDFESWEPGQKTEIVLTPCFHVFHLGCIQGWLRKHRECPSCRWDITDMGEQKAMSSSRSSAPPAPSVSVPPNLEIVVSDDSEHE
eukprot:TRINITY_DN18282_c0_g1_i1.p1 TRINITY_DN18282_c0_g1~~TRINITY_DN18282_c0_g1_i1.p1  ORF type:complete len:266 (+),score=21.37 TRINITY_DN18282_c0_g1_i1:87-884(+)